MKIFGEDLNEHYGKSVETIMREKQLYEKIQWQERVETIDGIAWDMDYEDHLQNIEDKGFTRSPSARETFSLLIDYLGGFIREESPYHKIAKNIIEHENMYMCDAMRIVNNKAIIYHEVTLDYVRSDYALKDDIIFLKSEHDITGLKPNEYNYFGSDDDNWPEIFTELFGREFQDMPWDMLDDNSVGIYLPPNSNIVPLCLMYDTGSLVVDTAFTEAKSRGVK